MSVFVGAVYAPDISSRFSQQGFRKRSTIRKCYHDDVDPTTKTRAYDTRLSLVGDAVVARHSRHRNAAVRAQLERAAVGLEGDRPDPFLALLILQKMSAKQYGKGVAVRKQRFRGLSVWQ